MKRFTILGGAALAFLAASLAGGHSQSPKASPVLKGGPTTGLKLFVEADLAVVKFSGAYHGFENKYHVGGTVKNVGNAGYNSRTRLATGGLAGRRVQLYAVNPLKFGRSLKLLRTLSVPSLKANEAWDTPTITVSPREVPGPGNARFVLMLTPGDSDRDNDSKQIEVSFVN